MKLLPGFASLLTLLGTAVLSSETMAQTLPSSLGFTIDGSFVNATPESSTSILTTDNDLTNGYAGGFDLQDAPAALNPTGQQGAAAFQWGVAPSSSSYSSYLHPSALWFQPLAIANVAPERSFELGHLFYRNGTIKNNSGASWVDLALTLSFSQPLGQDPISVVFGSELINTQNSTDPVASADIVSLRNLSSPIDFTDASGNRYFLELTFQVDQDTIDGTLSTQNEFRVFEGGQGRATLLGRFTTTPVSGTTIPEPSTFMIGALLTPFLIRRKR